jgi:hypothetical protein
MQLFQQLDRLAGFDFGNIAHDGKGRFRLADMSNDIPVAPVSPHDIPRKGVRSDSGMPPSSIDLAVPFAENGCGQEAECALECRAPVTHGMCQQASTKLIQPR